jgi:hypothetical protein
MTWNRFVLPILLGGIAVASAIAQTTTLPPDRQKNSTHGNGTVMGGPPMPPVRNPNATGIPGTRSTGGGTNRREPCWKVAGVSQSAMEERRTLSQQTRQEVEAVCADAALSPAQRQTRIRELHQQEKQQLDGLISPAQREAMHACQEQRGGGEHGGGGMGGGGGEGPCGVRSAIGRHGLPSATGTVIPKD